MSNIEQKNWGLNPKLPIGNKNITLEDIVNGIVTESNLDNYNAYCKLENGLLICYGKKGFDNLTFTAYGGSEFCRTSIANPFDFPVSFLYPPTIIINTANDSDYLYSWTNGIIRDKDKVTLVSLLRRSEGTGNVTLQYIAIGRWR